MIHIVMKHIQKYNKKENKMSNKKVPNVVALINVSESIVDIITDNTPMKKMPMANWGSTNSANCKYANDGFPSGIKALAYNPEKSVNISKTNQKQTDNKIPFRAIIGDFAAAHLW